MAADRDGVDVEALAALRPGAAEAELGAAFGDRWRPPASHREGWVDAIDRTHGVTARLTRAGRVGQIVYDYRFNGAVPVEGIRMRQSLDAARRARPDLAVGGDMAMRSGVRQGVLALAGGARLTVEFTTETVTRIAITDPAAAWPEKLPFLYPAASAEPGAPFADPNLKLAVMSALIDLKQLDLGSPEGLVAHAQGRPFDDDRDRWEFNAAAYSYLVRYPLDQGLLDLVTEIGFDGGSTIYCYAYPEWHGESDEYDVASLAGIESCPNLRRIHCSAMLARVDLRELVALRHLEEVKLSVPCTHVEALLDMPALRHCRLMGDDVFDAMGAPDHPTRCTMDALKARGVKVWIHWISHRGDPDTAPPAYT